MKQTIKLRPVTIEEEIVIRRLAASPRIPYRLYQRVNTIVILLDNPELAASQAGLIAGFKGKNSGVHWIKRFNRYGLEGLKDKPKLGRPSTYDQHVHDELINLALQKPDSLGYPFTSWTLERLGTAFEERSGVHLCCTTIWKWVENEGYEWRRQPSWSREVEQCEA